MNEVIDILHSIKLSDKVGRFYRKIMCLFIVELSPIYMQCMKFIIFYK